jgi:hypothetical protein
VKKLTALIVLVTFIYTATSISTAFAADAASPATPPYEIKRVEPSTPAGKEKTSTAETVASSEATNAYLTGIKPKYIETAIFITALVAMTLAISSDSGSSSDHGN